MQSFLTEDSWRMLGISAVDLYIPILTFVFGEAQMGGPCAVISAHRLRQEFYGLTPDHELFRQRVIKEAVHELGHTVNLTHCEDYRCVMASSHAVEWIDLKDSKLCAACRTVAISGTPVRSAQNF
jgi:archaemetzincin